MQRLIALTCEALARSMYALAAQSPHTISIRLYRQGLHNTPKRLRETLQEQIDAIQPGECDAILLAYGMWRYIHRRAGGAPYAAGDPARP